ncbi:MAG TPA: branched-chain amino acid ABC transporter permease/ATP-binding protein [Candidatus Dormibacteraeota bacterium]|nr:branched-chain amino acid ABC transporter permease/ATP-binding protein [Candidatus Dormibacteraeota bacterium]
MAVACGALAHDRLVSALAGVDLSVLGFRIYGPVLALGAITGMTYGLLAAGLVLVYRASGIINFAHGQVGAFGAVIFGLLVSSAGLPYWVALPVAIAVGALVGAGTEIGVIRRLRSAPRVMSVIATLGLGQVLLLVAAVLNSQSRSLYLVPEPPGFPTFHVGRLFVSQSFTAMLVLTPCVVAALAFFLRRTRAGLAIRGAAANPDTARMIGVPVESMATIAWAIAGAVATFTALLILPSQGGIGDTFGPGLVLRALLPAVIARMNSLPVTLVAGLAVGEVEQLMLLNYHQQGGGLVQTVLFAVILVVLLFQPATSGRGEAKGSWAAIEAWPPLPDAVRRIWSVRNLGRILAAVAIVAGVLVPLLMSNQNAVTLTSLVAFVIVGLSLGIITGLGGQVSLGHFALAGLGALAAIVTVTHSGNFLVAFASAGAAAAVASLVIGLPALRIRGMFLAVTTLALALSTPWILQQSWALGTGVEPGRPQLGTLVIDTGRPYYFLAFTVMLVCVLIAHRVWTGGFRRALVATRDNEDAARAFTVNATLVKVQAFVLSGFLAGVGGAVFAFGLSAVTPGVFPVDSSVRSLAVTVVGGAGVLAGPIIGALYIVALPAFLPLDSAALAATAIGWLLLVLHFPGGAAQAMRPLRDRVVAWLAARAGVDVSDAAGEAAEARAAAQSAAAAAPAMAQIATLPTRSARGDADDAAALLETRSLARSFGGIRAVSGVSIAVREGETVGLIGPNGAGKTTLFELISGFVRPDSGSVWFDGRDITRLGPEARGRLGLIRSFQDVALFPTMSVLETVQVALERRYRTRLIGSLIGEPQRERDREAAAREIVATMGLDRYRDVPTRALSTGTRRIAELSCLIALRPRLLLLDEPSSGIAQRETEALAGVIARVKADLSATVVIIEHDMPLVLGLSDRIVAMETGTVIADERPVDIVANPRVIESYLGEDAAPLERSDTVELRPALGAAL